MYDRGDNKVHHGKNLRQSEFKQELTISSEPRKESISFERLFPREVERKKTDEEEKDM